MSQNNQTDYATFEPCKMQPICQANINSRISENNLKTDFKFAKITDVTDTIKELVIRQSNRIDKDIGGAIAILLGDGQKLGLVAKHESTDKKINYILTVLLGIITPLCSFISYLLWMILTKKLLIAGIGQ
jgi:hypothetical protein